MNWRVVAVAVPLVLVALIAVLIVTGRKVNDATHPSGSTLRETLIVGGEAEPSTLDPQTIDYGYQVRIASSLFETLVKFKPDSTEIGEGLATRWEPLEGGKVWEFTLRTGVTFHDGTPFDAAAVVFTFERFRSGNPYAPKTVPYQASYAMIQKVEAIDAARVRFTLDAPSAVFLKNLAMFPAGIVSPAAVKKSVDHFGTRTPVGTGPYRLVEWRENEKIVLEAFSGYWGPRPKIRKIVILPVRDASVRVERLLRGELDFVDGVPPRYIETLRKSSELSLDFEVGLNVCYLGFNCNEPPYSDANFRKAVAHALDRRALIRLAYYGEAEPAKTLVPPGMWGHDPEVPDYEPNLEKAKEYLSKVRHLPEKVQLIHMSYSRPYVPEPEKLALAIKDDLTKIGLQVELVSYPEGAYSEQTHHPKHPMFLLGWMADNPDPDNFLYALLHRDSIPNSGTNCTFFDHPEFNALVKGAQTEMDERKRLEMYRKAQRIYKEHLPSIPLVHVRQVAAIRRPFAINLHPIETRLYEIGYR